MADGGTNTLGRQRLLGKLYLMKGRKCEGEEREKEIERL